MDFNYVVILKLVCYIFFVLLISCNIREWNNPFDPDCPKELFTPSNFTAKQQRDTILLQWNQNNTKITGFKIEKKLENGLTILIANLDRLNTIFFETNVEWEKQYEYYLYAFAGTNTSNKISIKIRTSTPPVLLPEVSTEAVKIFTNDAAILGGTILSNGGTAIIEKGICLSKSRNPTLNNKIIFHSETESFSEKVEGLSTNTTYYIKAYAINSLGVSFGDEVSFKTDNPLTDIDGNTYKTVIIGAQVWMAENLKVTKYRDGSSIPNVTDATVWKALSTGAYCFFKNQPTNGPTYGALYNFYAVADNRGLSPTGWHVPSDNEWMTLRDYLGGENIAGGKLKETGIAHWDDPNVGADNSSGFTALGGSWRGNDGLFYYHTGFYAAFWSSTEYNETSSWFYELQYGSATMGRATGKVYIANSAGLSVRCIKD